MITVGGSYLIEAFGFEPNKTIELSKEEKIFIQENITSSTPICHWDFVNLDYEHNFFLNVFPKLDNKKICIISSFTDDIKEQLKYKNELFINKCFNNRVGFVYKDFNYPNFKSVEFIKIPICMSYYKDRFNLNTEFKNSLELLEDLKTQVMKTDSEIYLIGAGLYSNLLCDFIKTQGKISINCGSSTQLFFGLTGNRFKYLENQKVTNEYWKYPEISNCITYTEKKNMGELGFNYTDGIQAYIESEYDSNKNILISGCFATGTLIISKSFNLYKTHYNIFDFKNLYPENYDNLKVIIFPIRDINKIYRAALFQDITCSVYEYSPFHKGNFLDEYINESDDKKKQIINEIDIKQIVNFYNNFNWDNQEHLNVKNRINALNNHFNINIDYTSKEIQEFIIDNKKLIVFNIDDFDKNFKKIAYMIFGVNNYKLIYDNLSIDKWYSKKYQEFLTYF